MQVEHHVLIAKEDVSFSIIRHSLQGRESFIIFIGNLLCRGKRDILVRKDSFIQGVMVLFWLTKFHILLLSHLITNVLSTTGGGELTNCTTSSF